MFGKLRQFVSGLTRETNEVVLECDEVNVRAVNAKGQQLCVFKWSEITQIQTYKQDRLTTDDIKIVFQTSDIEHVFSETCKNFMAMIEMMEGKFPSIDRNWYREVMTPTFAANHRILWKCD